MKNKKKPVKKAVKVRKPKPEPVVEPKSDWELHMDGECSYDCPFCYENDEEYEEDDYDLGYNPEEL